MSLNSVYHPGEAIPEQVWISWDCVECDTHCEAVVEEGEILQSQMFCYRCGAKCAMPHAILVETGEYELETLLDDMTEDNLHGEITFTPEDEDGET